MTFNPNIPEVTESPLTSASPVQINFSQFAAIFSNLVGGVFNNHLPFNNANQGKHGAVIFQNQALDPGIDQDLSALYAKNAISAVSPSGQPQLFAQITKFLPTAFDTTDAANIPMQLTYNSVGTSAPVYYSFLPGGYLIYFGMQTAVSASPQLVTLTPAPSSLLIAIANPNTVEINSGHRPLKISTVILTPSTFNVYADFSTTGQYDFSWLAIGVQ